MADIVLPATTFLEHDDLYTAGGHTHLQLARQVIEPLGESRSNHQVICALAERLGAQHPGFELSAWELIDATLRQSGKPDAAALAGQHWLDCSLPFETAHFLNGFATPDGFAPALSSTTDEVEAILNRMTADGLAELTGEGRWAERAEAVVRAFGDGLARSPLAHVTLVRALARGAVATPRAPAPAIPTHACSKDLPRLVWPITCRQTLCVA